MPKVRKFSRADMDAMIRQAIGDGATLEMLRAIPPTAEQADAGEPGATLEATYRTPSGGTIVFRPLEGSMEMVCGQRS